MICRSSQVLALSLAVSCEPKSLLTGIWGHKGWLAIFVRGLSGVVEESSSEGFLSNR